MDDPTYALELSKKEVGLALELLDISLTVIISSDRDHVQNLVEKLQRIRKTGGVTYLDLNQARLLLMNAETAAEVSVGGSSEDQCRRFADHIVKWSFGPEGRSAS